MKTQMTMKQTVKPNAFVWLGLKLDKKDREDLKRVSRENNTTMQSVLSAFVKSYIENPDRFKIKVNMELSVQ